jgi:hypothetical protein
METPATRKAEIREFINSLMDVTEIYQNNAHNAEELLMEGMQIKWYQFAKRIEWKNRVILLLGDRIKNKISFDKVMKEFNEVDLY